MLVLLAFLLLFHRVPNHHEPLKSGAELHNGSADAEAIKSRPADTGLSLFHALP
jgi:hypothetical protein